MSTLTDFLGNRDRTVARQKTLKTPIHCSGIGLHSGDEIAMTLRPAAPGSGIRFVRTDLAAANPADIEIPARWDSVVDTRMCTMIGNQAGATVATIEHLMAALAGCEIDNVSIELSGGEVPVMDGSAAPFVFLIDCAGTATQDAPRRAVQILKPIEVRDGDKVARLLPGDGFTVACDIDFDNATIGRQTAEVTVDRAVFKADIARARTFGFLHEVNALRSMGLARGGSLDNAVVIGAAGVMNEGGLRYGNEFVRHKMLDAIGDLYTAGAPLIGRFEGSRCGHAINNQLLRALFADETASVRIGDHMVPPTRRATAKSWAATSWASAGWAGDRVSTVAAAGA